MKRANVRDAPASAETVRRFGLVVEDVQSMAQMLSSAIPGLGPWLFTTFRLADDDVIVGEPVTLSTASAHLGAFAFELVQAVQQPGSERFSSQASRSFIGIQTTGAIQPELHRLHALGFRIAFAAQMHDGRTRYFLEQGDNSGPLTIELTVD